MLLLTGGLVTILTLLTTVMVHWLRRSGLAKLLLHVCEGKCNQHTVQLCLVCNACLGRRSVHHHSATHTLSKAMLLTATQTTYTQLGLNIQSIHTTHVADWRSLKQPQAYSSMWPAYRRITMLKSIQHTSHQPKGHSSAWDLSYSSIPQAKGIP